MVHIILLILKTAGIVFLSLLGIVLLLLAAILFLPVTYRVYAEKEEKIKNNRLALLKQITLLAYQVGDLSLLVV